MRRERLIQPTGECCFVGMIRRACVASGIGAAAGCVNAYPAYGNFENSIYCTIFVGLISVAHQAI
ncbi:hypothetical protein DMI65_22050 [Escherichia coli]|nr:hypothetical protein [Escherichia coli]